MKAVRIIQEEVLQLMNIQERRIIAYVAAKKHQTGYFPLRHKHNSKRLAAFRSLVAKGIIIVTGSNGKSVTFRLNSRYSDMKFNRFYTSLGLYVSNGVKTNKQPVSKLMTLVNRMFGSVAKSQKVQPVAGA